MREKEDPAHLAKELHPWKIKWKEGHLWIVVLLQNHDLILQMLNNKRMILAKNGEFYGNYNLLWSLL